MTRDGFDWKQYDIGSVISIDSISDQILEGNRISTEGYSYGDYCIGRKHTNDSKQEILDIKSDKYRRSLSGEFYPFKLDKNRIIFMTSSKPDTVYINEILVNELQLSFRNQSDYDQYIFSE